MNLKQPSTSLSSSFNINFPCWHGWMIWSKLHCSILICLLLQQLGALPNANYFKVCWMLLTWHCHQLFYMTPAQGFCRPIHFSRRCSFNTSVVWDRSSWVQLGATYIGPLSVKHQDISKESFHRYDNLHFNFYFFFSEEWVLSVHVTEGNINIEIFGRKI